MNRWHHKYHKNRHIYYENGKLQSISWKYDKFNRLWRVGWVSSKDYVVSKWIFGFCSMKKCVWQIRILGMYITSTNKDSIRRR